MTQTERVEYLIRVLQDEPCEYRNLQIPTGPDGRRHILRAMMNARPPQKPSRRGCPRMRAVWAG